MSGMTDWGDGTYELTAQALAPATDQVIAVAGIGPRDDVLDVGCGTGNAALAAAAHGARVTGVDPAPRLVDVARERAAEAGVDAAFDVGEAAALPYAVGAFDAVLSVFGVIFAPDARAAVADMVRVTRPGGRVVVTSWLPAGAIADVGRIVREELAAAEGAPAATAAPAPGAPPAGPVAWGDPAFAREAFGAHGATVHVSEHGLPFTHASPEGWFAEQEAHHPVWRGARARFEELDAADRWDAVRARTVAALAAANEDPGAFRATSRYLVIRADVPRS